MIKVDIEKESRICQGDIYRDVDYYESVSYEKGVINIQKIIFPLVIVLAQDCDLAQNDQSRINPNSNQDKCLLSVLVAPLYNVEHVYNVEHLSGLGYTMQKIPRNKTPGQYLCNNERPRYHYLEFPSDIQIVPSVIDFKHYFSVNVDYLIHKKKNDFVCKIAELYRESISHRFAFFLSRIGLPQD